MIIEEIGPQIAGFIELQIRLAIRSRDSCSAAPTLGLPASIR